MIFVIVVLAIALVGSILAAFFDLKTTEIPDKIPYAMAAAGLVLYGIQSYMVWSYWPILNSLAWGLGLLGFGFLMYYFGQWGGGDAKVLSAIGFLIPELPKSLGVNLVFPFPLSYSFNVFLVGAVYMMVYALIISIMHKKIIFKFFSDIKASSKVLSIGSVALFLSFFLINWLLARYFEIGFDVISILKYSILPLLLTIFLYAIWKFAKVVEDIGFKKKIPVSELKVGDVLLESKLWEGINEKELNKVKRSGRKFVVVKEGVRFAGAFPIALLFTIFIGDGILLLMNFLL
ncbi:MAG TPA: prepilin peptidase [archaeon]|nr:prepilin peptidase [archaeon]